MPVIGEIKDPGTVEGGDTIWLDPKTLVVGRGIRTNQNGIDQLAAILQTHGISVIAFDLPLWDGKMLPSPDVDDLTIGRRSLPCACAADARGALPIDQGARIHMILAPANEFAASNGLSLNVLPTSPRKVIMVAGFPKTKAEMEAAGCTVETFDADALCIACEGGPTCLTGPVWRA